MQILQLPTHMTPLINSNRSQGQQSNSLKLLNSYHNDGNNTSLSLIPQNNSDHEICTVATSERFKAAATYE